MIYVGETFIESFYYILVNWRAPGFVLCNCNIVSETINYQQEESFILAQSFMLRLTERIVLGLWHLGSMGGREATHLMASGRRKSKMDSAPFEIIPQCSKKHLRTHLSKLFPKGPKPRDQAFATWVFGRHLPRSQLPLSHFDIIDWCWLDLIVLSEESGYGTREKKFFS